MDLSWVDMALTWVDTALTWVDTALTWVDTAMDLEDPQCRFVFTINHKLVMLFYIGLLFW
jgi:hypothetical protein